MKKLIVLLLALALCIGLLAACGGDNNEQETTADTAASTNDVNDANSSTNGSADASNSSEPSGTENTATSSTGTNVVDEPLPTEVVNDPASTGDLATYPTEEPGVSTMGDLETYPTTGTSSDGSLTTYNP